LRILLAAAVLAVLMAVVGVAYSLWSEQLQISASVATGELDAAITSVSMLDSCSGSTNDYAITFVDGVPDFSQWSQLDDDVACGSAALVDSDDDGDYDTVVVELINAYPRYYNMLTIAFVNNGDIPFKLWYIEIGRIAVADDGSEIYVPLARFYEDDLEDLEDRDGYSIDVDGDGKLDIALNLDDGLGDTVAPNEAVTGYSFNMVVLDDAPEASNLKFYIKLVAVQWNAYTPSAPTSG